MNTTQRLPHAPSDPLPELADYLEPFHPYFVRNEGRQLLERSITGLLTIMRLDSDAVNWNRVARIAVLRLGGFDAFIKKNRECANIIFSASMVSCID
jgi:hypothetical protein